MRNMLVLAAMLLCACGRANHSPQGENTAEAKPSSATASKPSAAATTKAPIAEPEGAIDPTSAEGAGQVVQSYGALIEQKSWSEANALWGDEASAAKFQAAIANDRELHLEIGNPGDLEGAAGSIYITIPAIFYGDDQSSQPFRRSADVILRRVNDVPGSTEAQRRWHIERIDWAGAP